MKNPKIFYKCEECGNLIYLMEGESKEIICCSQKMNLLLPRIDGIEEQQHIPIFKLEENKLTIKIGKVAHPMALEHYISWIAISQGNKTQLVSLENIFVPTASFFVDDGEIKIYSYCNIHGLWAYTLNNFDFNETVCSPEFTGGCI